jgi:hypothetical protein
MTRETKDLGTPDGLRLTVETFEPSEFEGIPGALVARLMSASTRAEFALQEFRWALTEEPMNPDMIAHVLRYGQLAKDTLGAAKEAMYAFLDERKK